MTKHTGTAIPPPQWWKHLRDWKRVFWKRDRVSGRSLYAEEEPYEMSKADNLEVAKEAIDAIFSDTSVPRSETVESLQELREEIDLLLDCLAKDDERA